MPLKYIDAGTGKIRGPSHTYDWHGGDGRGEPGDEIQDVGPNDYPGGRDDFFARDNHEHLGIHSVRSGGAPIVGDLTLSSGHEVDITSVPGSIIVGQTLPAYGVLYYDAGECGAEMPLGILCGPCALGEVQLAPLVAGVYDNMQINEALGILFMEVPGVYLVRWDISFESEADGNVKVTLWNAGSPVGRSRAYGNDTEMSGHVIMGITDVSPTLYLGITCLTQQDPALVLINHLQFSAILLRRS